MSDGIPRLEDLGNVDGKRVLVRTDFNVPIDGDVIVDDLRIRSALPTLRWLIERGAVVTAATHLGRPKGRPDPKYSVEPVRDRLAQLAPEVTLLENLRFDLGETANDAAFVHELIADQDLYVNDAFGASHRAHASIVGPPQFLPSAMGRLLEREVEVLLAVRNNPKHPFVAILGGAKVGDKLGVIDALLEVCDSLIIGGGMCFTFLAAQGHSIGASLFQPEFVDQCKAWLQSGASIHLPHDLTALGPDGTLFDSDAGGDVRQFGVSIPDGWQGVDIGPGTASAFTDLVLDARTVLWNGPMGAFEDPRFAAGTKTIAHAMAETKAFTIVGGGDSAAAVAQFDVAGDIDHISTGGGASLELIEQGDLPGLGALRGACNV